MLLVFCGNGAAQVPSRSPLRPLAVTQLDSRQQGTDLDSTRPISVVVAKPTAIADLLVLLVRDTRLSVVPDPDVTGEFRGELKDVTLRQALDTILRPAGLSYSVEGSVIRVFKRRQETRRFDLNYAITRRGSSRTTGQAHGATQALVTSSDTSDIFSDLSEGIRTLLSVEGRFNIDRKAGLLQATDYPERLDQVQSYLDAVRDRATRQVHLQARVLEVELTDQSAGGVDWSAVTARAGVSATGVAAPGSSGAVVTGLTIKDFSAFLSALGTQGRVNVIASPAVNTLNNEPVIIRMGSTTSHAIVLTVTPNIAGDRAITLSITPSLTELTGHIRSSRGEVPVLSVREADTIVRIREHETVVISGLVEERPRRDVKKPRVLGKTDLVILLTPTVIPPAPQTERP